MRKNNLIKIENFLNNKEQALDVKEEPFDKLMFFYKSALNQLTTQIRTLAMDFWANFEHKVKYKTEQNLSKKTSNELVTCAKMLNRFDNKIMKLNNIN